MNLIMTPAHTDSPLRRSDVSLCRESNRNVSVNDDAEERREARRRTLISRAEENVESSTSAFEDNETLKKYLEIYNNNKLSRANAWSVSLIDTLSTLLDRHHKSFSNFKVAGSSLEASSKVYSLRVDSIHSDVLRMSAGLNARKFNERQLENGDDDDDNDTVATGGEGGNDPVASAAGAEANAENAKKAKSKRQRKVACMVTKNKETLNARLDTVPLQDPVFGKLNSVVGSINSSIRLMNNILLTTGSELRLRTTFGIWDKTALPLIDYTEEVSMEIHNENEFCVCDRLFNIQNIENFKLRPLHEGYIITETPVPTTEDKEQNLSKRYGEDNDTSSPPQETAEVANSPFYNVQEMSMAFDMNAECEPMPMLTEQMPIVDVDYNELDDLTIEERNAINNCRGLRKAPVIIEDLRPVDANSKLEYSYRALDKISQFWAGPSHWKFKRSRNRLTNEGVSGRVLNHRAPRYRQALDRKKAKQLKYGQFEDDAFIALDQKFKNRKANIQKKWDSKKLKLPVDLQLNNNRFSYFTLAPGLTILSNTTHRSTLQDGNDSNENVLLNGVMADNVPAIDDHFADHEMDHDGIENMGCNSVLIDDHDDLRTSPALRLTENNPLNSTILEIASNFEGAPAQVTRIIVPFARRAKVIDMKNLKRSCGTLLNQQLRETINEKELPQHPMLKDECYEDGIASFNEIYAHLPQLLTKNMSDALSTSIAFYSILHLANEYDLRLIPQEDLADFKIRKVNG
uniref:Condensin complex subunit 2 n=1 Tax=Glossina brevipalpis TaxID=37001 RepID=A0A1A9WKC6_9MUSC